jgi:hypothetical protein
LGVWLVGTKGAKLCSSLERCRKFGLVFSFLAVGLWNFNSVRLFCCGASANKFCVLELTVHPQFIVNFFLMLLNIICAVWKVRHLVL